MHALRILRAGLASPNLSPMERSELESFQICGPDGYAEPGYSTDKAIIIVGNFNPDSFDNPGDFGRTCDLLGKVAELEWSDEWATCGECGKLVRVQADSYCWTRAYHIFNECEIVCHNCIDADEYLEDVMDNATSAVTLDVDPTDHGFEAYNGQFEAGLHPGQTDNPRDIAERVRADGWAHFVFKVDSVGQFDIRFRVYVKD